MPNLTATYGWQQPLVNDPIDSDLWGGELNSNLAAQDTLLSTVGITPAGALAVKSTNFTIVDGTDATKVAEFDTSAITTATTRTLAVQDVSGTVYVTGGEPVAVTDGGTGSAVAATGFDNIKQPATTTYVGVVPLATAAQMITATDTTHVPSVSVVQNHPGVAKAWVSFNGLTGSILASYNISGVTRNSQGLYTIGMTIPLSSANYAIVAMGNQQAGSGNTIQVNNATVPTASGFQLRSFNTNTGGVSDSNLVWCVVFGNQ